MQRFVAFLRAINVGGRTVKMDRLRSLVEELGLERVRTFIASGNVIFDAAPDAGAGDLEGRIARHLERSLGYPVATFIRSPVELATIVERDPFTPVDREDRLHVAFLAAPPSPESRARIAALESEANRFHVEGREVYWHWRRSLGDSDFSGPLLERAAGESTMRNINTLHRILKKLDT